MISQLLETMRVVALPTKTNFRGINIREAVIFNGPAGWGEFSPFLEYDYQECVPWLLSAIASAALPDPKLFRNTVSVNGTIPALTDMNKLTEIVQSFPGCQTFKVKVGDNLAEDLARLAKVRALRPDAKLRIDINGQWSVQSALTNLYAIYENIGPLEYVEQPCSTLDELRELKSKINIPITIAGDEVLRKAENPFDLDLTGAVDILVLKVQPLGGIERAHQLAAHHGLPIVVSSALETAVGISSGLKLAASFASQDFASGLATGSLLTQNLYDHEIINGEISITEFEPNFDGLDASPERFQWWKNRVMKTAELLT